MTGATALMRTGRKRKSNVKRDTTTGRSRGEIIDLAPMLNQPHRRGAKDPKSELLGYPLGRLRLEGNITETQHQVGNQWATIVSAYSRMIGVPLGSPRGASFTANISTGFYAWEGDIVEVDKDESERRRAKLRDRYNDCHDKLHEIGRSLGLADNILKAMRVVCIEERYPNINDLGNLRAGLNALNRIFKINA